MSQAYWGGQTWGSYLAAQSDGRGGYLQHDRPSPRATAGRAEPGLPRPWESELPPDQLERWSFLSEPARQATERAALAGRMADLWGRDGRSFGPLDAHVVEPIIQQYQEPRPAASPAGGAGNDTAGSPVIGDLRQLSLF